ncbi:hypothetical protein GOARA_056_02210 [Gordonia araii NBRC 100433]|uniref:Uncharacterized protein n=1 Tax=Gordonia araii NBRC 100433 TaxID=1073574 RepID=G7H3P8_9ACTN|nr:hypothetical protein [Gordonia araii]NNG96587.1 hypothetical protein [Gordonia araii NBRC 100433]GAB10473.1 hypothetical protein GOARA_056_02210 [Gordonia araii NBRC 100433]
MAVRDAVTAGVTDVVWSLGFAARHAIPLLAVAALPAAQRVYAALHPGDDWVYSWPIEIVVLGLRLATVAVVWWLAQREDDIDDEKVRTFGTAFGAIGDYARAQWVRVLTAVIVAACLFGLLNVVAGPVVEALVEPGRAAEAWGFAIRNLVIIPLYFVAAYGIVRPALRADGA